MVTDDLRHRRLEVIAKHMDTEVTQEFDRTLATFNGHSPTSDTTTCATT